MLSESRRMKGAAETDAGTDVLTGLANRRTLNAFLDIQLARQARSGSGGVAVLCLDLDGFQVVDDQVGRHGGDRLLQQVSESWTSQLRSTDLLAGAGGDEFVIVLADRLSCRPPRSPGGWSQ